MPQLPERSDTVIDFLKNRRSNLAKIMTEPGPSKIQLEEIMTIGARVPDHRKLEPWRFIVFEGDARAKFGNHLAEVFKNNNPDLPNDRVEFERDRFMRAPIVIAVISSPVDDPRGTPVWEQQLSSAAVCYNLCLAAQAHGFAAQWLTEWYSYDSDIRNILNLQDHENFSGFIYLGSVKEAPSARKRPELRTIVSYWDVK